MANKTMNMNDKSNKGNEEKKAYRTLGEVSDEELREAVARCNSYRELFDYLNMTDKTKTQRLQERLRNAGIDGSHLPKQPLWTKYSREELQSLADISSTYTDFGKRLGYSSKTVQCQMGKRVVEQFGLSFQASSIYDSTLDPCRNDKDYVQTLTDECYTFTEIADKLGYKSVDKIKKRLDKLGVDYSHFDPWHDQRGGGLTLSDLQEDTNFSSKQIKYILREYTDIDIEHCEKCGIGTLWNGREITLEVHHKNGNHSDNRVENLAILCPNCHRHTEGRGKQTNVSNKAKRFVLENRERKCEECGLKTWLGSPIPLEFHHKDGSRYNDENDNLELLCSNCHTQTDNFGTRKRKMRYIPDDVYVEALKHNRTIRQALIALGLRINNGTYKRAKNLAKEHSILHIIGVTNNTIDDIINIILEEQDIEKAMQIYGVTIDEMVSIVKGEHPMSPKQHTYPLYAISDKHIRQYNEHKKNFNCKKCGTSIDHDGYCQKCHFQIRQEHIPPRDELKDLIRNNSMTAVGKRYGVSSNAVVKWCKKHELPHRKNDINSFTDEEWELLDKFTDDMQIKKDYTHDDVIDLLEKFHSVKYASEFFSISENSVRHICRTRKYNPHAIEWQPTTCHIIGTDLYFRTATDAGRWLSENTIDFKNVHEKKLGAYIKDIIECHESVGGYKLEYVKEEDYFDIITQYKVITYIYE